MSSNREDSNRKEPSYEDMGRGTMRGDYDKVKGHGNVTVIHAH